MQEMRDLIYAADDFLQSGGLGVSFRRQRAIRTCEYVPLAVAFRYLLLNALVCKEGCRWHAFCSCF